MERTIVFARTKHGADRIADHLKKAGVPADAIHGDKSQSARVRALESFRSGDLKALVATDIAARGIDIDGITHVINFDLPNEPESYVHRIGRTARAGTDGSAVSFCDAEEVAYLKAIEKTIRQPVPADHDHPYHAAVVAAIHASSAKPPKPAPKQPRPGRGQPQQQAGGNKPQGQKAHAPKGQGAKPQAPQGARVAGATGEQPLKAKASVNQQNRHNRRPAPHGGAQGGGRNAA